MNIGLITSFLISGILLLSIGWMNRGVSYNTQDIVLTQQKQEHKVMLSELLSYDLPKIGYTNDAALDTLISYAGDNKLSFYANIDNSSDGSVEKVVWEFTGLDVASTNNPDDKVLLRTENGVGPDIKLGVTNLTFNYYDEIGGSTPMTTPLTQAQINTVKQIEVIMELQSSDPIKYSRDSQENYIKTAWVKRFTPRNLPGNL